MFSPRPPFSFIEPCLYILCSFGPNHIEHLLLSKKKDGFQSALNDDVSGQGVQPIMGLIACTGLFSKMDSEMDKHVVNINYLKIFNPISTYGRLSSVMRGNKHNGILKLPSIVNIYIIVKSFS